MKPLRIHLLAEEEMESAIDYYANVRFSLGADLNAEINRVLALLQSQPTLHARYKDTNLRKCLLRRFPYAIYYSELDQLIWIAAFAHHKRRQGYWSGRAPDI